MYPHWHFDPHLYEHVTIPPEEKVRCQFIEYAVNLLHYPPSLMVVEKQLKSLPHLKDYQKKLPNRRIDLMWWGRTQQDSFFPLIIIECKANIPLSQNILDQVWGYNYYVKARYVGIVTQTQCLVSWFDHQGKYRTCSYFPYYRDLINDLK